MSVMIQKTNYSPGHPWYYRQGGKILKPAEITLVTVWISINDKPFFVERIEDDKRYLRKLKQIEKECLGDLERDIKRYREIIKEGPENFSYLAWDDPKDQEAYYQALALKHNHIKYNKSKLEYIHNEINRLDPKPGYQFRLFINH